MNFESFKQEMASEQKTSMNYDPKAQNMNQTMANTDMYCKGMAQDMMMPNCCPDTSMGAACMPVYECPRENVCHRYICYEVPHIMPCNTRIINHHVYRHTYRPEYTCCEENVVSNVYDRPCC